MEEILQSTFRRGQVNAPMSDRFHRQGPAFDRLWPDSAELGAAASRRLTEVQRSCCQGSREGSP